MVTTRVRPTSFDADADRADHVLPVPSRPARTTIGHEGFPVGFLVVMVMR
jgi:hypothetical protein